MKRLLLTLLPAAAWAQEKPNVIWLMADDLGYGDISCYGATRVQTPNIDRVASQGVRFTDMHACASTSTPSRYGILTGEYPFCHPGTDVAAGNAGTIIWPQQYTMADMMRSAGYRTGAFGKWLETGAMFPKGGGIAPVCVQQMCFCGLLGSSCLASKHSDGDRVGEWISLGRRMQRMGWRGRTENAVRCDGRCTALRHLPENTIEWRTVYKGCQRICIPWPVKAACGRPCKALIQVWNRLAPPSVRHCGCGCGRPRG